MTNSKWDESQTLEGKEFIRAINAQIYLICRQKSRALNVKAVIRSKSFGDVLKLETWVGGGDNVFVWLCCTRAISSCLLLTCPIPFCFSPCHLASYTLRLIPLSFWENREWWKKTLNEMPSQLQQKIQLVRGEILRAKCNTAKREESIREPEQGLKLQPCLPPYNWDWLSLPFQCGRMFVNITETVEASQLTEFRCECVGTCDCVWEKSYVMPMG